MERFGSIIQMICFMIDVVGSLRLPPTVPDLVVSVLTLLALKET
jgi:hypothetical protein